MTADRGASPEFVELLGRSTRELRDVLRAGAGPDPTELAGREFRGANAPRATRLLGIRRFVKGFRSPADAGYNVRVPGADLAAPWVTASRGGPREYAPFRVAPVDPASRDHAYPDAILLDYGAVGSGAAVERALRDYLVRVPGSDLLLGHAFAAVGRRRVPVAFFVLEPWSE